MRGTEVRLHLFSVGSKPFSAGQVSTAPYESALTSLV